MAKKSGEAVMAVRVLDNIIFIAEIFADREDEEIPDVPMLELARSFELKKLAPKPAVFVAAVPECAIGSRKFAAG